MDSSKIRDKFLVFFGSKGHEIVPSAPMVVKNDPTLMFTNAGMNQFKDWFLGNTTAKYKRVANSQKCLRVSGKHNDLEEVGVDTYHHTMFEMLGNWSFGDYFKKDAIDWAWELLTAVYKIPKDRLYVTIFEGSKDDKLERDTEAFTCWNIHVPEDRIINGNKKDNFWEMGDTGPCGPCSEIHIDLREEKERRKTDGKTLVNTGNPQVVEIWNLVFMEFNRAADGKLEKLPARHVDTGMGFERLCMVLQGKRSTYDTDIFQHIIKKIEDISGLKYRGDDTNKQQEIINIAMRVIADHVRAISFSIADGQLPSNTGAGYVIRRILRRAVRYGYQSLGLKEPFIFRLVPVLANQMGKHFPELLSQKLLVEKVIKEEEVSFFRTLEQGLKKIDAVCIKMVNEGKEKVVSGKIIFELYDTYGFPVDLTALIARGYGLNIDEKGFSEELEKQKARSREDARMELDDWVNIKKARATDFVGYDSLEAKVNIIKYRKVKAKGKELFQLVLDKTPFYAESGGQVGDTGVLESNEERILITDTKKENELTVHFTEKLPVNTLTSFTAKVDKDKRQMTMNNHTATHLLHAALRQVLGKHVEQKGSLVNDEYLRFDFSHFSKVTDEEIQEIESIVNKRVRENIPAEIKTMPIDLAKKLGAMALFGEKYGEEVRVVTFDKNYSMELCGGTHVPATGVIGLFKIVSESAVAAGVRRIEAVTAGKAEQFVNAQLKVISDLRILLKNPADVIKSVQSLVDERSALEKKMESLLSEKARSLKGDLQKKVQKVNGIDLITEKVNIESPQAIKDLCFEMKSGADNLFMVLGSESNGKPSLSVVISEKLAREKNLDAGKIVRELAKEIKGGGGGQPFYATAGGSDASGIQRALDRAKEFIK